MNLTVVESEPIRPFSNGSQHADWEGFNCDRCTKRYDEVAATFRCDLQQAIGEASWGDGSVSANVARRMGYDGSIVYVWQCREVEWTPESRAEHRRRQTPGYRLARWRHGIRQSARKRFVAWWEKRRMAYADRQFKRYPDSCRADWVVWALSPFGDREKPNPRSSDLCREEGKRGSCYCGRFCLQTTEEVPHATL